MFNPLDMVNGVTMSASLDGFSKKFKSLFHLTAFPMTTTNNQKRQVDLKVGGKSANLPYGWFKPSNIDMNMDQANINSIARYGSGNTVNQATSTLKKSHFFPCRVSMECAVRFQDFEEAALFVEKMLIAMPTRILNFELHLGGDKWTVGINQAGSSSMPFPSIDDIDNPDGAYYELSFNLTMETKVGFMVDVAKLNNNGEVTLRGQV